MTIKGRRGSWRLGPIRVNRSGLRLTSVTLDLGFWSLYLWKGKRR